MLQTLLIGSARGNLNGGGAQFIRFVLHYTSLFPRLLIAVAVWLVFGWVVAWPILSKLGFFAVEIYASLLVIRFFAGLSDYSEFGRMLGAMWLPIGVIAIATYLLFVNDQGRELGVGLMDKDYKGLYLAFVLVYWALNNWLSARVGLRRAFPQPERGQALLFWGPRLLGVCAHLLAACSLSVAASSQPDLQGKIEWWLIFAAPLAIVLATVFVWLLDKGYLSNRFTEQEQARTRKWVYALGGVELALFAGLGIAFFDEKVPRGFLLGTLCIAFSALLFLTSISVLRKNALLDQDASVATRVNNGQSEAKQITVWTVFLALLMLTGTAAIWIWPMSVGEFFGSLIIACFAFGSFLAITNLFDLLARLLAHYAEQNGFVIGHRAVGAVFVCFLVLPAILVSLTHSFHRVRLCDEKEKNCTAANANGWTAVEAPAKRPSVAEAARAWYAQAEPVYHSIHPNEPVPMLIVATAGGGIRAAYWTATILEKLETDLGRDKLGQPPGKEISTENLMRNLLFAISSVSGGSVGAAAYAAAVHAHEAGAGVIKPTDYLKVDFLAPGLASMAFIDGPSNLLPDLGQIDRGKALELGFEYASRIPSDKDGLVAHKFLSFFPAIDDTHKPRSWRPALLFNATHQETGRRMITSHIKIERDVFFDSYDALQVLESDVRLSTAAHNSARFTYISPAGNLRSATEPKRNKGYVIDGGYFENYGAETALELANKAINAIDPDHENKVKLVVLQISSDPALKQNRTRVRVQSQDDGTCSVSNFGAGDDNYLDLTSDEGEEGYVLSYLNELTAPLIGIMSVREAHGTIAADELAASICPGGRKIKRHAPNEDVTASIPKYNPLHFSHLAMCKTSTLGGEGLVPPLGWVLSDQTRSKFENVLKDCDNPKELAELEMALGLPSAVATAAASVAKGTVH
jgi:hypothetical protein